MASWVLQHMVRRIFNHIPPTPQMLGKEPFFKERKERHAIPLKLETGN